MIRYEGFDIDTIYLGDNLIYRVYLGDELIWEMVVLSNFITSDNYYIVTKDNQTFNSKQ